MGLFDSDFNIEKYVRGRIPELDNLDNRELFKKIVGNLNVDLYKHIKSEYDELEKRVFSEAPKPLRLPDLITCVISADRYDLTDENMFPMFAEDLEEVKINAAEMISEVKSGKDYKRHNALHNVLADNNYPIDEAIVLSNENMDRVGKITYAPVYMAMFIAPDALPERLIYRVK